MDADDPLREWARLSKEGAEVGIATAILHGAARAAPSVEKFCTWLLAGTAAAAALTVANVDGLATVITAGYLRAILLLLLGSAIVGLVGKGLSLYLVASLDIMDKVGKEAEKILREHAEEEQRIEESAQSHGQAVETAPDMEAILALILPAVPWPFRRYVRTIAQRSMADRMFSTKRLARVLNWQTAAVLLQFSAAFIALLLATLSFHLPASSP